MTPPDVSILIVSFNTKDYLARCLRAIPQAAEKLAVEIIVVDNGSSDGSQTMLADEFPHVRVIQNQENVGFGKAHNIGAQAGRGRALLILNSDCELHPNALQAMVAEVDRDVSIGMVLCRILNPDGGLQPSVHESLPSPWSQLGDLFCLSSLRYALYRRPALHRWLLRAELKASLRTRDVAWGGGMCMVVRRDLFLSLGGFDERFFMYCEDMDLCKRMGEAGYRLRYLAEPSALHHWGKSTEQVPNRMRGEAYKSQMLYFDKHFPGWGGVWSRCLTVTELRLRQILFACAGVVPSPRRQFFQGRATSAVECLHVLANPAPSAPASGSDRDDKLRVVLAVLISFSLFRYLHDLVKFAIESPFIDFAHYYTFTTVVSLGLNPFDQQAVLDVDRLLNIRRAGGGADYPPLFYLFMQPWLDLSFRPAALAWLVLSQVCLAGVFALCLVGAPSASFLRRGAALFVFLNFQPTAETVALGQSNSVILLLVAAAWWGLRHGHSWLTAVTTAATMHIKIQYGLLIPLLWCMGARRASVQACGLSGIGFAVGIMAFGLSRYADYADLLIWSSPSYLADWVFNLSLRATLYRLFGDEDMGGLFAEGLWVIVGSVLCVVILRAVRSAASADAQAIDWAWGLSLAAVLILSPMTEEHHLVVLLLPLTLLLLQISVEEMRPGDWMLLGGGIVLLAGRYSLERFSVTHHGVLSLLMTGKLLGIGCLAWVLVRRLRASGGGGTMTRPSPSPPPESDESKILLLFLALVLLLSVFRYIHTLVKLQMDARFIDFAHYYTYATVVALGLDPFDPQAVAQVDAAFALRRAGAAANYPPLFYLFMQPWVALSFSEAVVAWGIVVQTCLFATLALCFRRCPSVSPLWGAAALFVVLQYQPLVEDFALGQSNVVLLFLVTLAWWGVRSGRPWVAACAVAMAMHIKAQYGLLLPLLWWMGHGCTALRACMMAMLGLLVGLAVLGLEHHLAYARYLLHLPEYLHAWTLNLSYRATLIRLLGEPGAVAALLLSAVLLVVFARAIPRASRPDSDVLDMVWGLGLVAIPLLSPLTEEHHLVVLLFPVILLLLGDPASTMDRKTQVVLVGSIVLLGSRYSLVQFPAFHQGALSLLTTGKLVGVAGLAWILVGRLRASARVDA